MHLSLGQLPMQKIDMYKKKRKLQLRTITNRLFLIEYQKYYIIRRYKKILFF